MANRKVDRSDNNGAQTDALISRIKERARNLYLTRQFLCTEAVLVSLNHGLGGGLTDAQAVAVAAPFCDALGESGCLCGALSGAVLASGLFLGKDHPYRHRKAMRDSARQLRDAFKAANGATCCRVLSQQIKNDKNARFLQCAHLTAETTELAARLILKKRPELLNNVDDGFLARREPIIGAALSRLFRLFSH